MDVKIWENINLKTRYPPTSWQTMEDVFTQSIVLMEKF